MKAEQDIVNQEAILQRKDSAVTRTVIQYRRPATGVKSAQKTHTMAFCVTSRQPPPKCSLKSHKHSYIGCPLNLSF